MCFLNRSQAGSRLAIFNQLLGKEKIDYTVEEKEYRKNKGKRSIGGESKGSEAVKSKQNKLIRK